MVSTDEESPAISADADRDEPPMSPDAAMLLLVVVLVTTAVALGFLLT